ncbi:MAG: hypothetical protein J6C38_02195 [Oscillospiraceae bacterium]|nr:hypothetical protein [Oscillospiraceae bacterium]
MTKQKNLKPLKIIGLIVGIIAGIIVLTISGFHIYFLAATPESFVIEKGDNYFEYETEKDSAGCAAAYALRALGDDVDAADIIEQISEKKEDGSVSPKALAQTLEKMGYKVDLWTGTLHRMRFETSKGVPVLTYIKSSADSDDFHFVAVVGADTNNMYLFDPRESLGNSDNANYNREINKEEFLKLWSSSMSDFKLYMMIYKK